MIIEVRELLSKKLKEGMNAISPYSSRHSILCSESAKRR